jgi:hypothetical protein
VLADDKPAEVGWLHYRLAVAFCATILMSVMLLIVPGLVLILGPVGDVRFNLYPYAFSRWGGAILVGTAVFGFAAGGERTANLFAFLWGTHPFWPKLEEWLYEHEYAAIALGWMLVALFIGFGWYLYR